MPLANPAGNSLSTQGPEGRDSHVHVLDDRPDDKHEHGGDMEHLNLNSQTTNPSSELSPYSEAEDMSSLGAGPTPSPAPAPAQNMRQQMVLGRAQNGEPRESQRLMQINDLENSSGEMVRDIQTREVGKVNGATEGVIGSITRHERGLQEGRTGNNDLTLRLDLNLDVEVQLKAKIRGDLTLQLMYVSSLSILCDGRLRLLPMTGTELIESGDLAIMCSAWSRALGVLEG
ncbi:hypothetical protein BDW75DRAFT_244233 [Aspergillus navahoensis]